MKSRIVLALAGFLAALAVAALEASAAPFTYAGFTWDQVDTPDVLGLVGNGAALGGASFSAGNVTTITQSVGFNAVSGNSGSGFVGEPGFDASLTLGRQAYDQQGIEQSGGGTCLFGCAVNMPGGNNGATTRHGLEVSWSGGRALANEAGADFVVYESGSAGAAGRESMIVRVSVLGSGFTDWFYQAETVADFEAYTQTPTATTDGAFAVPWDLSTFGLTSGQVIDKIQIANLFGPSATIGSDRIGAGGRVLFVGDPNYGSGALHGLVNGALDPDPLYVGVLHATVPEASTLLLLGSGLAGIAVTGRRRQA